MSRNLYNLNINWYCSVYRCGHLIDSGWNSSHTYDMYQLKRFFLLQKFKNPEKCQTFLSKEFQISISCCSQVKVYWKKMAICVKVDCFLKMKSTEIPRALPSGPSTGLHPGPTGWGRAFTYSLFRPSADITLFSQLVIILRQWFYLWLLPFCLMIFLCQ